MGQTAPKLELRDIHLPGDPSFWPLAPGWWVLIVIACVIAYFVYKKIKQINAIKHTNKLLQDELLTIETNFGQHNDKHQLATDISELLNRFVKYILKDAMATSLTGKQWIDYLNNRVQTNVFDKHQKELTQAQYTPEIDYDAESLIATVKTYFPKAIRSIKKYDNNIKAANHA